MAREAVRIEKVLLLAPQMEARGTSEYILNLAKELRQSEVEVAVFCVAGPMLQMLHRAGVPVAVFEHLEKLSLSFGEQKKFLEAVRGFAPQLVHAQSFRMASALKLLAKRTELPLVLTLHWIPRSARAARRLSRRVDGIITTTQAVRQSLVNDCGVERGKASVIPIGLDLERLAGRSIPEIFRTEVPVVGSLGPIEAGRGHDLFIRAASMLVRDGVNAQFVIAGAGTGLPAVRKLVSELALERWVTLATDFAAYEEIIDALDVVVQNSLVDISGFSMLEAMAHGRPVIAFNTGTACEIIEDHKTGRLVPKGDSRALSAAILELIAHKETARQMGQDARHAVAETFNVRTIVRETMLYYAGVLSARAAQSS